MSLTKRRQVNQALKQSFQSFLTAGGQVLKGADIITSVNYDLSDTTTQKAVEWLGITISSTQILKKNCILLRNTVDDVIFCIDWYINRCSIDLKRYREKLHGEKQES